MTVNKHGLKMKGLKNVAGDTKELNGYYSGRYFQLNYNKKTGEVFTDYHYSLGQNQWNQYNDPDIIAIGNISNPVTMQEIADMIKKGVEKRIYEGRF